MIAPDNPDADQTWAFELTELVDGMMEDILIKFEVYLMAHDVMDFYDAGSS